MKTHFVYISDTLADISLRCPCFNCLREHCGVVF